VWAYRRYGRLNSPRFEERTRREPDDGEKISTAVGVSHCGAGCTLGDIIGEWLVLVVGVKIAGDALWGEYIAAYALAFTLGIAFQ